MYRIAEMSSTEIFIEKAFFSMKIIILKNTVNYNIPN